MAGVSRPSGRVGRAGRPARRLPDRLRRDGPRRRRSGAPPISWRMRAACLAWWPIRCPDLRARLVAFLPAWRPRGACRWTFTWTRRWTRRRMPAHDRRDGDRDGLRRARHVGHLCSLSTQDEARALARWTLWRRRGCTSCRCRCATSTCRIAIPAAPRGARHHAGSRGQGARHPRRVRIRQHPRSVLRLRRSRHAGGAAPGHPDRASGPRGSRLGARRDHHPGRDLRLPARHACARGARRPDDLFRAREWTELFARPHSDRIILRAGQAIDRTLPDYAELDQLMEIT